jgi:Phasin protein
VEKEPEPLELNAVGKQSIEQAYVAVDQYFELLKRNFASVPTGGAEWGEKWKRWAETNIGATQEYFKRLSRAKDLEQILRVHMDFMQSQATALGEQIINFGKHSAEVSSGEERPAERRARS